MSSEVAEVSTKTHISTGRIPCESEGRDRGGDASIYQGTLKMSWLPPSLGRGRNRPFPTDLSRNQPHWLLVLSIQVSKMRAQKSLWLKLLRLWYLVQIPRKLKTLQGSLWVLAIWGLKTKNASCHISKEKMAWPLSQQPPLTVHLEGIWVRGKRGTGPR